LAERGVEVDHVTIYRWVQRFARSSPRPRVLDSTWSGIAGRWMRRT
jgi:transposase-like protein